MSCRGMDRSNRFFDGMYRALHDIGQVYVQSDSEYVRDMIMIYGYGRLFMMQERML